MNPLRTTCHPMNETKVVKCAGNCSELISNEFSAFRKLFISKSVLSFNVFIVGVQTAFISRKNRHFLLIEIISRAFKMCTLRVVGAHLKSVEWHESSDEKLAEKHRTDGERSRHDHHHRRWNSPQGFNA